MPRPTTVAGRKNTGKKRGGQPVANPACKNIVFRTTPERKAWLDQLQNKSAWFNALIDAAMQR